MNPDVWLAAVLGAALGASIVAIALRRKQRKEIIASTLVPHRTRQLLSVLQSGAVIVRRDRRAAFVNNPAAAIGVARPDGALLPAIADLAELAWKHSEAVEEEITVKRGVLGVTSQVHVRAVPLDSDLVLAVVNDHTEARIAEQSRREFAVNVSHELKTPVGALSLLAESIEEGADDEHMVRSFAGKMRKEARRLTKLIQEIIEISRLQGGESVLDYEDVHIADVIAEALDGASLTAESKNITLTADVKTDPMVMGDRDLLLMALRNLVDNAVHYSDPGKRVTVSCKTEDGTVSIAVVDQGIGIDPKDQERIFERFFRTDPARSRDSGGTGLGLSIVKHVALQHAGTVDVWSQRGVGSTFTLRLQEHGVDPEIQGEK
ncbi:sensor histidine kinase [Demequina aurantiaca]|uniref:sensor histidine kinase n=1 Tax=Demequina aurantiaca TaxID=676200 RepID=UPI000781F51A|nr:ATP-binding protein [Demequina aurantiaca]